MIGIMNDAAKMPGFIRSVEVSKKNMNYNKLQMHINDQTKQPLAIPMQLFGFSWGEKSTDPIPMLSCIKGRNGVGKSTLLNLIRYYLNDDDTSKLPFKLEFNDPNTVTLEQVDETCLDLLKINANASFNEHCKRYQFNRYLRNKETNINFEQDDLSEQFPQKNNLSNHGQIRYLFMGKDNQENKKKMNERLKSKKFKFYLEIDTDNNNEMVFKRLNNPNSSLKLKNLDVKDQLTFFKEFVKLDLKSNQITQNENVDEKQIKFMNFGKLTNLIRMNLNSDLVLVNKQLEDKGFKYLIDIDMYKELTFKLKPGKDKHVKNDNEKIKNDKSIHSSSLILSESAKIKFKDLKPIEQLIFLKSMAKLFVKDKKSSENEQINKLNLLDYDSLKAQFLGTDGAQNLQKLNNKLKKNKKFQYEVDYEKQNEYILRLRCKPDTKLKLNSLTNCELLILLGYLWELNKSEFTNYYNKLVLLLDEARH